MEEAVKPVVYLTGDYYTLVLRVEEPAYVSVKIGERVFNDAFCGVMRSEPGMRSIRLEREALDKEKSYAVIITRIKERVAYCTEIIGKTEIIVDFRPVPDGEDVTIFELGDTHNSFEAGVNAAKKAAPFDALLLCGDIPADSGKEEALIDSHDMAWRISKGKMPVIYTRGNHESRGALAERLGDYLPACDGKYYFTFRLGCLWAVVLDCGEDKVDGHVEYGGSVAFESYRQEETRFLEAVAGKKEYDSPIFKHIVAISHVAFPCDYGEEFNIEQELYEKWSALLEKIGIKFMIAAHTHRREIIEPNDPSLRMKTGFTIVTGSRKDGDEIGGTLFTFRKNGKFTFEFTA